MIEKDKKQINRLTKQQINQRSFTLTEMLIIIAIMVIIISLGMVNYRKGQGIIALNNEAERLASVLREARTKAMAGEILPDGSRPAGYGIFIKDDKNYILFADKKIGEGSGDNERAGDGSEDIEEFSLPQKIYFQTGINSTFIFSLPNAELSKSGSIKLTLEEDLRAKCVNLYFQTSKVEIADCEVEATICGNSILEIGEECDDGNTNNCDGCKGDCSRADNVCRDNIVECTEECDGSNDSACSGLCQGDCTCLDMGCNSDEDCDDSDYRVCNTATGECVPNLCARYYDSYGNFTYISCKLAFAIMSMIRPSSNLTPSCPDEAIRSDRDYYPYCAFYGLEGADNVCQRAATLRGFPGQYKAWLSGTGDSNYTRNRLSDPFLEGNNFPFYRADNLINERFYQIARNFSHLISVSLTNNLILPLHHDVSGDVWTGTNSSGNLTDYHCNNWHSDSNTNNGTFGDSHAKDGRWTNNYYDTCDQYKYLYCFQYQ